MEKIDLLLKEAREINKKIDHYLEEQAAEDNMDLEKTKLPNMDEIFGKGPVTDYVKAQIDYLQAEDSDSARDAEERRVAAAKELEADQNNTYRVQIDEEAIKVTPIAKEEPEKVVHLMDDFAEELSESIGVIEGAYRESFKESLIDAIHTIEERNGKVKFVVHTAAGSKKGYISMLGDRATVEVDDKTFTYDFHQEEEAEEAPVEGSSEDNGDAQGEGEDSSLPCGCTSVKDCKFAQEVEPVEIETPEQFVAVLSDAIEAASAASMEIIEGYLIGVKELDRGQLDLVRHYLKQLPENSSNDIDELSDKAVELAWKRINYLK